MPPKRKAPPAQVQFDLAAWEDETIRTVLNVTLDVSAAVRGFSPKLISCIVAERDRREEWLGDCLAEASGFRLRVGEPR